MLTKRQFAFAVGATEKWVDNAARVLGRRLERTTDEARWMGLVRQIAHGCDIALARAGELATGALREDPHGPPISVGQREHSDVHLVVDVKRYHSRFGVALAVAIEFEGPRHRGPRPPVWPHVRSRVAILTGAAWRGVDLAPRRAVMLASPAKRLEYLGRAGARVAALLAALTHERVAYVVVGDVAAVARGALRSSPILDVCYEPGGQNITRLVRVLQQVRVHPRGVPAHLPFIADGRTIAESPLLPLETEDGPLTLRRRLDGVGDYEEARAASEALDLGSVRAPVLTVPALVAAVRAIPMRVDPTIIPELEAVAVLLPPRPRQQR